MIDDEFMRTKTDDCLRMVLNVSVDDRCAWERMKLADLKPRARAELHRRAVESFCSEHDLAPEEFGDDHWQVIFKVQHPEVQH